MQRNHYLRAAVVAIAMAGFLRGFAAPTAPPDPPASLDTPAFRDFTQRVQEYVKLHKAAPRLRTTKRRQEIVDRRQALAQKIREMRPDAKTGDIFTPEGSAEFRRVIGSTFRGPGAREVRRTVREGVPVPGWHLAVNGDYPEQLPVTTVPPTLLRRLPQLPTGVAYRIIGHDFVLTDTLARVIVDFIPGVLP